MIRMRCAGELGVDRLAAEDGTQRERGPVPHDPQMPPTFEDLQSRPPHETGRLRVVSGFQRDLARIRPPHRSHLRVRLVRRPALRGPTRSVQRQGHQGKDGMHRGLHEAHLRDQDEVGAANRGIPPGHARPESLVCLTFHVLRHLLHV